MVYDTFLLKTFFPAVLRDEEAQKIWILKFFTSVFLRGMICQKISEDGFPFVAPAAWIF